MDYLTSALSKSYIYSGATPMTIAKMTKLPLEQVERIIHQIEKNRKILANQNKEEYKC